MKCYNCKRELKEENKLDDYNTVYGCDCGCLNYVKPEEV